MQISTKTRYSLRAIIDLALNNGISKPVYLRDIAKREELPIKYLETLFYTLKKASILKSIRGAQGGYILATPPEKITILDIVEIFEGPLELVSCGKCQRKSRCPNIGVYDEIGSKFKSILAEYSVRKLMDIYINKNQQAINYHI